MYMYLYSNTEKSLNDCRCVHVHVHVLTTKDLSTKTDNYLKNEVNFVHVLKLTT